MSPIRRLRVPVLLIGALVALLAFSATAAAETRTGESASPISVGSLVPELTLVKGSASYETTGGSIRFDVTTAAAPQTESEGAMAGELLSVAGECSLIGLVNLNIEDELPIVKVVYEYKEPTSAAALVISSLTEIPPPLPVTKAASGTTTTLSLTSSAIADQGYNCAVISAADQSLSGEGPASNALIFPISAPPPPPPAPAPTPTPTPASAPPAPPAPTPAALSIGKLKPLKLKAEKWKTIRVKVTNTGGTATAPGSLRVRAPATVFVKPEKQRLPALAPGASWTVAVRVRLPAQAAKKTTLRLVGTAPGVSATLPLVIRVKH
jgi:hypothetical protein